MACSSIQSSSSFSLFQNNNYKYKYDVFVSFRGEDTRNNFTDHLFGGLQRKGIVSFRDDTKLERGESISTGLIQAIESSRVFIVVFSKNYANSTWCLQELAKMLHCCNETSSSSSEQHHKRILPVFYDVDPSEVRNQSGNFGKAFEEYEERFKDNLEMMVQVQTWKSTLREVANLSGFDVRTKPQYGEIEKILEHLTSILDHNILSIPNDLVGVHSPLLQLEKLLNLESQDDVRVLGICGMGGIGKTTLATVLYDRLSLSNRFNAGCFIDNVSKIFRDCGSIGAQKQLLSQALNEENLHVSNHCRAANLIRTRLRHMKALIVLDNVDQFEQLEKLSLHRECLGAGSRIIIISRDKHILSNYRVNEIFNVELLNYDIALLLFGRMAFKCDDIMRNYKFKCDDIIRNYTELTYEVLDYARGLPLAIKVLGSFLYGRDVSEWRSALIRLRKHPSKDIMDVLRLSFDGLEEMDKEIFLDVACFFNGFDEQDVKEMLESCGFLPNIGIKILMEKSLINIVDGRIRVHDLLQELGKKIVREKSPNEPSQWSRLWYDQDILNSANLESKAIKAEAMVLSWYYDDDEALTLDAQALSKMCHLRLLYLVGLHKDERYSGNLNCLASTLCYLKWEGYPFMCLPSSFSPNKLVQLILVGSNIKYLWEGIKVMPNLKVMDLSFSKNLIKTPDFRRIRNLEKLCLQGCTKLRRIDPSASLLGKLTSLNLRNCSSLVSIPSNIFCLNSLEILDLHGCLNLFENQVIDKERSAEHLKIQDMSETTMHCKSKTSISKKPKYFLEDSAALLLSSFPCFPCLRYLDLSFCNLNQVPDAIGLLRGLESLNLAGNNFERLPSIKQLSKLTCLDLQYCMQLRYCPELPTTTILSTMMKSPINLFISTCLVFEEIDWWNRVAFRWMLQVIQAQQESSAPIRSINILIPGSEIPRWYNIQSVGIPIRMDLSCVTRDGNWIGVSFCVAFCFPPSFHRSFFSNSFLVSFYLTHHHGHMSVFRGQSFLIIDPPTISKDLHLWLFYMTREEFISKIPEEYLNIDRFNFVMTSECCWVQKCGMRWVYKEDLEHLNANKSTHQHKLCS